MFQDIRFVQMVQKRTPLWLSDDFRQFLGRGMTANLHLAHLKQCHFTPKHTSHGF